jgi:two-component system, NarL family, sensor histidine kinase DesK
VREGATNVIRHSRAERCEIRLTRSGKGFRAEVRDNGRGSPPDGTATGSGLSGLAERVAASGGSFEVGPLPTGGFRLRVSLPLLDEAIYPAEPPPKANGSPAGEGGGPR